MKRFQSIIQKYITNHQKHKKYLAAVLALSILVSFAVPVSLIMPAVSMTNGESPQADYDNNIVALANDTPPVFDLSQYPACLDMMSADSWSMYVSNYGEEGSLFNKDKNSTGNGINTDYGDYQGKELEFYFDYTFNDKLDYFDYGSDEKYMYINFKLSTGLTLSSNTKTGNVMDTEYNSKLQAGTYEIKDDGYILVTLTEDYINYINDGSGEITGTLKFYGTLSIDNDADGNQNFWFGNYNIPVTFQEKNPTITKNGNVNSSNGCIEWTVTINNQNKNDLNKYELYDDMLKKASEVTFNPQNTGTCDKTNGKITFANGLENQQQITITYKTPIDAYNTTIKNNASLKKNGVEKSPGSKEVLIGQPVNVTKTGTADYNTGDKTYNNEVIWTIEINSCYGQSLDDYIIDDANFPSNVSDITVSPNASLNKNNDGKYILSTNEKSVILTYKQKITKSDTVNNTVVNNTVTVKTPDEKNPVTGDDTVTYQSKSDLYNLTKEGSYDKDTHLIKWTVKVSSTNQSSLNGYKLVDEGFKNAVDSKFYVNNTNNEFNDYNLSESTMTLNSNNSNIEFYYYTKATASDSGKGVTNSVELKNPDDDTPLKDTTSKEVHVDEFRNQLSKQVVNHGSNSVASSGEIKQVIGWKASITYDNNLANKTYTDTLSVVNGESNATHTITQEQLNAIEVYAKVKNSDDRTKLVKGNDYTIDPTDNGFTVKFNATLDEKGYNYVDIEYNTTATIPASESYDTITEFKNSGSGFGDGASGSHSITRGNPNVDNKLNLIVNKTWDGNDDASKRPDVYIKVMYKTKVGNASASEWKPLKKDSSGNPSVEETLNDNYIVELKKDGTWSTVLNSLPMEKSYALDDGTKSEVTYYYYKLVEVDKDGTEIKYISTENGLYKVSNSNNTNTDSASQSLTVTNTYYGNINITGIKNWSNDSGYTDDRKEVTVELRRSTDQYNWSSYTVVETETLNSSNNWSYTWNNLPSRGFEHGDVVTYYYKLVETKCGDTTIDDNNKIIFTNNGYYESSVSSNVTNSSNQTLSVTNTFHKNIDISGQKIWRGDNIENKPAITLQLMRSEKDKNDWKEYLNLTLNSDSNWKYSFNNLPTKALDDNNQIKDYEYKVVETKIGNDIVSSNKAIVSNGYYIVSYSDNNAISNNKSDLNITNTFHKTKNLTITANKVWDDEGYEDKRPDSIILQLQQKANNGNWEKFGDENTIISNGENQSCSWDNLVSQSIDENGNVTEYTYKVVEVGYVVGDKTYRIPDNSHKLAIDDSGFYEVTNSSELSETCTVTITNKFTPDGTISITPKKVWAKDTDTARYDNVTLRVQVKNGNEWVDYQKSDGSNYEFTLSSNPNTDTTVKKSEWDSSSNQIVDFTEITWTGDVISNLPKQKITITEENVDGKTVRKIDTEYYTYRLVEVFNGEVLEANDKISVKNGNDKYEVTYSSDITMNNGEFTVTNTFVKNIGVDKYAVDVVVNNGNVIVKNKGKEIFIDKDILTDENSLYKKTIDGKQYYVFNWVIDFDTSGMSSSTFDQLPEGFTLVDKEINKKMDWDLGVQIVDFKTPFNSTVKNYCSDGYYWRPYFVYSNMNGASSKGITNPTKQSTWSQVVGKTTDGYFYDTASNKVYFSKPKVDPGVVFEICYSTKVECATLDAMIQNKSYPITNHVIKLEDDGEETKEDSEATVWIKNQAPSDLISKEYVANANQGWIGFSLDINPDGKNLSNGDTIDIEDIFKTESYIDKDKDNQFTPGSNLVDVLMKSISIYSVDANGNETKLDRNNYILNFESNEKGVTNRDNETGEALIKLTVPDETHIRVKYLYKMIANNNTPSVRNGCKSSERDKVTGKFPIMAPGMVPPVGDTITFSNTAKLYSDGVSAEDSVNSQEYVVSRSGATISTNALPKIKKVNVGNYNINNLSSKFLLARYDDSKKQWLYATEINEQNAITKWSDGFTGLTVCKNAEPINVDESYYQISLDKNSLYKLVEVRVPTGYEGSNLNLSDDEFEQLIRQYLNDKTKTELNGTDYSVFLEKYVPVYYFVYNSIITSYPDGINSSDVIQVKSGEDVEIPNSELIDIGVDKQWVDGEKAGSTIDVELYWSYNKSTSKMPSDAQLATAEELGIMYDGFSANKTVNSGKNQKVWEDLPNGKDSKPIYYYIKETAYTIDNMKYTLVTDKEKENYGKYVTENGYVGEYFPTYVGNATNSDSVITVNNSQKLILKKVWKNASNMPLSAGKIPADEILVTIYGTDKSDAEVELFKDVKVTKNDNWESDITELLKTNEINLEDYKSFRAEESGFDTKDYVVSCVFNLNADTGEITVTNKCVNATDASVTVNKSWSDGNDTHEKDSIKVSLYQSTSPISDITNLTSGDLSGAKVYKNVELNVNNDWSYTWTGLPLDNSTDETNANKSYYYYVLETDVIIDGDDENKTNAKKYETTYSYDKPNNSKTTYTINNTRNSIKVQKEWYDENNELISNELIDEETGVGENNPDLAGLEIQLTVSKKDTQIPENGLKVIAFGDSITDGYANSEPNCSKNGKDYPSKLINLLKTNYIIINNSNVYDFNKGVSREQIGVDANTNNTIRKRVTSDIPTDTNIVCFIGGTNDIHQSYSAVFANPEGVYERFVACIEEIKTRTDNKAVIFVGSIPHFDFYKNGTLTDGGNWWGSTYTDKDDDGKTANSLIDQYNAKIKEYADANDNVYFVDVCSVVTDDYIRADGCHPNDDGYTAIANLFYNAINNYYTVSDSSNSQTITLNSTNEWTAIVDVAGSGKYYVEETSVKLNGKDVTDDWEVSYKDNGQTAGGQTPIIVKNKKKPVPKTSLSVEKTWKNDAPNDPARDGISLSLMQSTNPSDNYSWVEYNVEMPTLTKTNDKWTYRYENLPAKDISGKTYYYKILENPMENYTPSYPKAMVGNNESDFEYVAAVDGDDAGTLRLTNERKISLTVKKIWSDGDTNEHLNDKVEVKVYRSTNPDDAKEYIDDKNLILHISSENVSVGVNSSTSVTANKSGITATSDKPDIATATVGEDGKTITITGVNNGKANITVTDESGDTATINVTVSALEIFLNGESNFTIEAGQTGTLSAKMSGTLVDNATFVSDNPSVISVNGNEIIANGVGSAVITATVGNISTTQTITVKYPPIPEMSDINVVLGTEYTLNDPDGYGGFSYSINSSTGKITLTGNKISVANDATANETATITVTREGCESKTFTVTALAESPKVMDSTKSDSFDVNLPEGFRNNISQIIATFDSTSTGILDIDLYKDTNRKYIGWCNASGDIQYGDIVEIRSYDNYILTISMNNDVFNCSADYLKFRKDGQSRSFNVILKSLQVILKDGTSYTVKDFSDGSGGGETTTTTTSGGNTGEETTTTTTANGWLSVSNSSSADFTQYKDNIEKIRIKLSGASDAGEKCNGNLSLSDNSNVEAFTYDGNYLVADVSDKKGSITSCTFNLYNGWNGTMSVVVVGIEIYVSSTTNPARSARLKASPAVQAEAGSSDPFYYDSVEISNSSGGNWTATLDNLPVYDADGHKYYYWAVEEDVSGYTASYYFDDANGDTDYCIDATQLGNGEITIKNTKVESSSVEMPSTGGKGVKWYYVTGMAVMFVSAAGILIRRRKNPVK